jgi:hypothetical protein
MKLLKAAESELKAKKARAEANLTVLLENPIGIGEHTDLVTEVRCFITVIADAEDELEIIDKFYEKF